MINKKHDKILLVLSNFLLINYWHLVSLKRNHSHEFVKSLIKNKGLFVVVLLCFFSHVSEVNAQDPEFSQFYATPVYTNPALAGTGKCYHEGGGGRASINYRNQWPSLPGSFTTTAFSFDQQYDAISGGIGLLVVNDVAGEGLLTSNSISGIYSFQMPINRKLVMRFGSRSPGNYAARDRLVKAQMGRSNTEQHEVLCCQRRKHRLHTRLQRPILVQDG